MPSWAAREGYPTSFFSRKYIIMYKLNDLITPLQNENASQVCDAKIEFETVPIVAAVKEIGDAVLEYKKEERCINVFTDKEKCVIQKEKAIMGWRLGKSSYLENSIYFDNKERYRLGCLNKLGKLIIDFKYCIIEVVGKYIFAGYNGDYQYNTYQGLYDLYTIDGDYLFGGFTHYHLYQEENILACNWCGNWRNISNEGEPMYEFNGQSGYWALFDLSTEKITLKNGGKIELPYWINTGEIKSILPLRDGREYGIPTKTQILSYEILVCGVKREMPNLPIETLFIMGSNENYPCIRTIPILPKVFPTPKTGENDTDIIPQQTNINNHINIDYQHILYNIHIFTNNATYWRDGEKHLFTECVDYNLDEKKLIENGEYRAANFYREFNSNEYRRHSDYDFISPFDNPYYNESLDMDQQSPDFWDSL